jgi:hypothetical protein
MIRVCVVDVVVIDVGGDIVEVYVCIVACSCVVLVMSVDVVVTASPPM